MNNLTIHLLYYPRLGWLPFATEGEKEVYRGEYRATPEEALAFARIALDLKQ